MEGNEKFPINSYKYSDEITKVVEPIVKLINHGEIEAAEKKISLLALDVCNKINAGTLSPKTADDYFTLLDIYLGDNSPKLKLRGDVRDLIFECMLLHDFGQSYGADIKLIESLAKKICNSGDG